MARLTGPDLGEDPEGSTPIDENQKVGLKLSWVATRADLNRAEADNIGEAQRTWRRRAMGRGRRRLVLEQILDHQAARELHRDMYGDVWAWAGQYRLHDANIGVPWHRITEETAKLLGNALHWFGEAAPWTVDQAVARLHHQLVAVHPFPNGNGRHARELADLVLLVLGQSPFTWGRGSLVQVSATRRSYIDALIEADHGNYATLCQFARS